MVKWWLFKKAPVHGPDADRAWRFNAKLNLAFGAVFWFFSCTDLSWRGTIPDLAYSVWITLIVFSSKFLIRNVDISPEARRFHRWACLPSLVAAVLVSFIALIACTVGLLGTLFFMDTLEQEELQKQRSPSGNCEAIYSYIPGRREQLELRVHNRFIPFIERDVSTWDGANFVGSNPHYFRWLNDDQIQIIDRTNIPGQDQSKIVDVGFLRPRFPAVFRLPWQFVEILIR